MQSRRQRSHVSFAADVETIPELSYIDQEEASPESMHNDRDESSVPSYTYVEQEEMQYAAYHGADEASDEASVHMSHAGDIETQSHFASSTQNEAANTYGEMLGHSYEAASTNPGMGTQFHAPYSSIPGASNQVPEASTATHQTAVVQDSTSDLPQTAQPPSHSHIDSMHDIGSHAPMIDFQYSTTDHSLLHQHSTTHDPPVADPRQVLTADQFSVLQYLETDLRRVPGPSQTNHAEPNALRQRLNDLLWRRAADQAQQAAPVCNDCGEAHGMSEDELDPDEDDFRVPVDLRAYELPDAEKLHRPRDWPVWSETLLRFFALLRVDRLVDGEQIRNPYHDHPTILERKRNLVKTIIFLNLGAAPRPIALIFSTSVQALWAGLKTHYFERWLFPDIGPDAEHAPIPICLPNGQWLMDDRARRAGFQIDLDAPRLMSQR